MWRAVTNLAHADQRVADEEIAMMLKKLEKLPFSEEQRQQLLKDLEKPAILSYIMPHVTDPVDRGTLVHFARLMVWSDGEFDSEEERLVALFHKNAMSQIDIDLAIASAREISQAETNRIMGELEHNRDKEHDKIFAPLRWLYDLID